MRLEDIEYDLPETAIAQTPIDPRDAARLLVDRGGEAPGDDQVKNLVKYLEPGDYMVVNNTRVMAARLQLKRSSGGAVEVLLLEPMDSDELRWIALVRPGGKLKPGESLSDHDGVKVARFIGRSESDADSFVVEFPAPNAARLLMSAAGVMPLPPYIQTPLADPARYQTVFSSRERSAAAPTAGLHLTDNLLDAVRAIGVEIGQVELAVGLGTFKPVTTEDPLEHDIHSESYAVPSEVMERCAEARRVVAVGTTAVRALESAATFERLSGRTSLFIHRGYEWKVVDLMLTNFHMPRTSLLLMVDSFVGDRWRRLYSTALDRGYRFLSFGDAMLLNRHLPE